MDKLWFTNISQEVAVWLCVVQHLQNTQTLPSLLLSQYNIQASKCSSAYYEHSSFHFQGLKVLQVCCPLELCSQKADDRGNRQKTGCLVRAKKSLTLQNSKNRQYSFIFFFFPLNVKMHALWQGRIAPPYDYLLSWLAASDGRGSCCIF